MSVPPTRKDSQNFDSMACWNDAIQLLGQHRELLVAIAGVFVLLPSLAIGLLVPSPETAGIEDPNILIQTLSAFFIDNALWFTIASIVSGYGTLAMYQVMLSGSDRSVADILGGSLKLMPVYLIAGFISSLAIFAGATLFILPGLYFYIKFCLASPAIAAEKTTNPLNALRRSWELTKGNSIRIFFFLLVVFLTAGIIYLITSGILGTVARLLLPDEFANIAALLVDGVLGMALGILFATLYAAIFRQLTNASRGPQLSRVFD
jgi:hypothetical protein